MGSVIESFGKLAGVGALGYLRTGSIRVRGCEVVATALAGDKSFFIVSRCFMLICVILQQHLG